MRKKESVKVLDIERIRLTAIREKQSMRTSFRLSRRCIFALSTLSSQLGIKQKSLFELLVEDQRVLENIAKKFVHFKEGEERVVKTFVISRKAFDNLRTISDLYQAPRDALVQYAIERILPLLEQEKKKHQLRKQIMVELDAYQREGEKILVRAEQLLDDNDPFLQKVALSIRNIRQNNRDAQEFIDRCCKIEELD